MCWCDYRWSYGGYHKSDPNHHVTVISWEILPGEDLSSQAIAYRCVAISPTADAVHDIDNAGCRLLIAVVPYTNIGTTTLYLPMWDGFMQRAIMSTLCWDYQGLSLVLNMHVQCKCCNSSAAKTHFDTFVHTKNSRISFVHMASHIGQWYLVLLHLCRTTKWNKYE